MTLKYRFYGTKRQCNVHATVRSGRKSSLNLSYHLFAFQRAYAVCCVCLSGKNVFGVPVYWSLLGFLFLCYFRPTNQTDCDEGWYNYISLSVVRRELGWVAS